MFGIRMLEELNEITSEIIIVDRDKEVIEKYKDFAKDAFITDAINENALKKIIPPEIDSVIVDLGGKIEASIMTTNYLHKMGVKKIIAKAQTDEHGEVLKMVGATSVIFPDLEAARRITPLLTSNVLFNYMPVSTNFSLAEIKVNRKIAGKTLLESNIRQEYGLNVVAYRMDQNTEFIFVNSSSFRFEENQMLLVAGSDEAIQTYSENEEIGKDNSFKSIFNKLFPNFDGRR